MDVIGKLEQGGGKTGTGNAIAIAAKKIRCEEATLQAILETESGGDPFDGKGRLIILNEKHIFWRYLPKSLRGKAQRAGLATPKWSRKNYKGLGGKGSDSRWVRLRKMAALHLTAALMALSYGSSQIMGFNHKLCGYPDVAGFVLALAESEDNQDEAFVNFLLGVGLAEDLRQNDFEAIARRYNGSGQVAYYAGLMRRNYKKITGKTAKIKSRMRNASLRLGSKGYKVKALQEKLCGLGYHTGIDGDFGPSTRRALVAFQAEHGLKPDGIAGSKTETSLEKAVPIQMQGNDGRQDATVKDLKKRSSTARKADNLKKAAQGTGAVAVIVEGTGGLSGLETKFDFMRTLSGYADEFRSFIAPVQDFISAHPWLCLAVGAVLVWYFSNGILQRRMFDFKNWRHVG